MNTQENINKSIHPDIKRALNSIDLPEVQELIKRLSKYGLAVALPHAHADDGSFLPLSDSKVSYESGLKISFVENDAPVLKSSIPVMWRWSGKTEAIASCAQCDFYSHDPQVR